MFKVNFDRIVEWNLPPMVKHVTIVSFIKNIIAPVKVLYNEFKFYRDKINYDLNHNGQICHLRKLLNDAFDNNQRRITILSPGDFLPIYFFQEEEARLVFFYQDEENEPVLFYQEHELSGTGFDFIVKAPFSVDINTKYALEALVNYYKLIGKRYVIIHE